MKRLFTALCVMCVALAATLSCSVSGPEGPEAGKDVFEIRCGIEPFVMAEAAGAATAEAAPATTAAPAAAPATKVQTTVSGADLASTWEEGDAIGVFPSIGGDQVSFSLVSGAGSSNCIFNGDGWGLSGRAQYAAYFPYSADNYGDADAYKSVKVSYIGQKQAAKGAYGVGQFDFMACPATTPSFDDPADPFGTCTFTFKHLGALLMLDVTFTSTSTLSKLELITNGSRFTEFGTVDLSAAAPAIASVSKGTTLSLDVAGISVTAGETARFYLMVAPDNLSGEMPTVKVTTSTGAVLSKQLPVTFNFEAGRAYSANVQMPAAPAPTVPSAGDGLTIYNTTGNFKYRYGPSIIMNDDGTIDAWFASPGSLVPGSGMADVFTWRRSSDGGQTWSAEQVVLTGNAKPAEDWWSVCDPGAAHFDGYYYIAYTSTTNTSSSSGLQGLENNCYIARGTSPSGPWEKWNGTGWGGNPKPIIKYSGPSGKWGIGEPSIVVKDNTIFLYYTYDDGTTPLTKVATASRNNANWPGSLTLHGTAVDKAWLALTHDGIPADEALATTYDSCDVKFVEDYGLFYAFHTSWRLTALSRLSVWTSTDGLTFTYLGDVTGNVIKYAHNMGVSGDGLGHVNLSKTQYVSYAYRPVDQELGPNGRWSTYWSVLNY